MPIDELIDSNVSEEIRSDVRANRVTNSVTEEIEMFYGSPSFIFCSSDEFFDSVVFIHVAND